MLSLGRKCADGSKTYAHSIRCGTVVTLFALVTLSCSEPPTTTRVESSKRIESGPVLRAKIEAAQSKYAWIGDFHGQAMDEVVAWAMKHKRASKADQCAMLFAVGVKYSAKARAAGHMRTSPHDDSLGVGQATQSQSLCSRTTGMNIFREAPLLPLVVFARSTDVLTTYMNTMANNFNLSDGSPGQVNAALNGVIVTAAHDQALTDSEFEALVAEADFTASSDNTWYGYQQAGAFGGSQIYRQEPYSIFRGYYQDRNHYDWGGVYHWLAGHCNSACRQIGAQDAFGFGLGWRVQGPTGAFYGGIGASGSTALGLLMKT